MEAVQMVIGVLYYFMTAVIALVIGASFFRQRDLRKMILYAAVLIPFVLRALRVK
ncbi:MAG TPA: hypothetical protein PLM74_01660 [Bacillota bacterium]|jgi:hypothetical protein|nr:hypothetical protein [Bacillota bacterium]